jgi:hypothetical protein
MNFREQADAFFKAHPVIFAIVVGILTMLAFIVLLGEGVPPALLYKAF